MFISVGHEVSLLMYVALCMVDSQSILDESHIIFTCNWSYKMGWNKYTLTINKFDSYC